MKGITMTIKSALSTFGNGVGIAATALHNSGIRTQIFEIDQEREELEKKLAELNARRSDLEARLY